MPGDVLAAIDAEHVTVVDELLVSMPLLAAMVAFTIGIWRATSPSGPGLVGRLSGAVVPATWLGFTLMNFGLLGGPEGCPPSTTTSAC